MTEIEPPGDLFTRPDGKPLVFVVANRNTADRKQVQGLVEEGGGRLLARAVYPDRDHAVRLLTSTEMPLVKDQDVFNVKYIYDCVERGKLITNLKDYRVGVSEYEDYEPMDVLTGLRKWSQLTIKIVGEKVSDIEDEFEPEEPARKQSLGRKMPYSRKEDKNILTWIVDTGAFTQLKGNEVWKNMAKEMKRGRTWQSLKEHFKKYLISQLHLKVFGLTEEIIKRFKSGYGLLKSEESEVDQIEEEVEAEVNSLVRKNRKDETRPKDAIEKDDGLDNSTDVTLDHEASKERKSATDEYSTANESESNLVINEDSDESENLLSCNSQGSDLYVEIKEEVLRSVSSEDIFPFTKGATPNMTMDMTAGRNKSKRLFSSIILDSPSVDTPAEREQRRKVRRNRLRDRDIGRASNRDAPEQAQDRLRDPADDEKEALENIDNLSTQNLAAAYDNLFDDNPNKEESAMEAEDNENKSQPKESNANKVKNVKVFLRRIPVTESPDSEFGIKSNIEEQPLIPSPRKKKITNFAAKGQKVSKDFEKKKIDQNIESVASTSGVKNKQKAETEQGLDDGYEEDDEIPEPKDESFIKKVARNNVFKKTRRFKRKDEYGDNFRQPYSTDEEEAIVHFLKTEESAFARRKGREVWKDMEKNKICPGRTWQSMKQRWDKFISKRLAELDESLSRAAAEETTRYYTPEEDWIIVQYISVNERQSQVQGNALWKLMERQKIVPGRSWQSLKDRFKKNIMKKIDSYNMDDESLRKFKKGSSQNEN